MKVTIVIVLTCLLSLMSTFAQAQPERSKTYDTRILVDVSEHMAQQDPEHLRIQALRMLINLLPQGSYAGVWSFGDLTNVSMPYGQVNKRWIKDADLKAEKLSSQARYSDISEALSKATASWGRNLDGQERSVVILTSGLLQVSEHGAKNKAYQSRVLDMVPALQQKKIKVYVLFLSNPDTQKPVQGNQALLKQLAHSTGAAFYNVSSEQKLQAAFLSIFTAVAAVDEIPIFKNAFYIDQKTQEATILLLRNKDSNATERVIRPVKLKSPVGVTYSYNRHPKWIKWIQRDLFSLVTLSKPLYGQWHILADHLSPLSRVLVMTDLSLSVSALPKIAFFGEQFLLTARVFDRGQIISDPNLVKVIKLVSHIKVGDQSSRRVISAENPNEAVYRLNFEAQSQGKLDPTMMTVELFADGISFEREFAQQVEVFQSPITWQHEVVEQDQKAIYAITIKPRADLVAANSLQIKLFVTTGTDDQHQIAKAIRQADGSFKFQLPALKIGEKYRILAQVSGNTVAKRPFGLLERSYEIAGTMVAAPAATHDASADVDAMVQLPEQPAPAPEAAEAATEEALLGQAETLDNNEDSAAAEDEQGAASEESLENSNMESESGGSSAPMVIFLIVSILTLVAAAVLIPLLLILRKRQKRSLASLMGEAEPEADDKKAKKDDKKKEKKEKKEEKPAEDKAEEGKS